MNANLLGFRCTLCGATYHPSEVQYTCPLDRGNLDALYDYEKIARCLDPYAMITSADRSIWHYAPLLPETLPEPNPATPLGRLGWSPLYRATRLESRVGIHAAWLKDDSRLPSSSFKDRASAMVIAHALATGARTICTASTGNAASSLATLCAGTNLHAIIFVPQSTPEGKLAQTLIHGASVYAVQGSYDDAFELASQACYKYGWYNRSTGINPYTREGKKTAAYEIYQQLGHIPDVVVVPVGDGNIISGLHKGFRDLCAIGHATRVPRIIGVTAELAPALYRAWKAGGEIIETVPSRTTASGISVDLPRDGIMALRAVRETGGVFVEVSDQEMLDAMRTVAREAGVFTEPASASGYAGLVKALQSGVIQKGEEVVLQLTGGGLKDVGAALTAVGSCVITIDPQKDWMAQISE